jgi:hypothetical protein
MQWDGMGRTISDKENESNEYNKGELADGSGLVWIGIA